MQVHTRIVKMTCHNIITSSTPPNLNVLMELNYETSQPKLLTHSNFDSIKD